MERKNNSIDFAISSVYLASILDPSFAGLALSTVHIPLCTTAGVMPAKSIFQRLLSTPLSTHQLSLRKRVQLYTNDLSSPIAALVYRAVSSAPIAS
jgi:hypothetical protein